MTVSSKVMKSSVYIPFIALAFFVTMVNSGHCAEMAKRDIVVVEGFSPDWKTNWDKGRQLARDGLFIAAAKQYEMVLGEKPQIEVAKWEYCKILFKLKRLSQLPSYLESLIETDPYNLDYLAMAGYVSLYENDFELAKQYLGTVYSARPEGEQGIAALSGLIEALSGLGLDEYAFPLMEQLFQRRRGDRKLLIGLADTAFKLGRYQKSREYYLLLLGKAPVPEEILVKASEAIHEAGDREGAAELWKEIVKKNPLAIAYIEKLAAYYQEVSKPERALPYILSLIEKKPDFSPDLLLAAGRIYFYDIHRADKALRLFEKYLTSMPEHIEVASEIKKVREQISTDLLAIVENSGAPILWKDLQKITEDPLLLFNMMADKLEKQKKYGPALELLKIINAHSDDQDEVALRMARLYEETGNSRESYKYFLQVKEDINRDKAYFEKKLDFELSLGMSSAALSSSMKILEIEPDSIELRSDIIRMAGEIGRFDDLQSASQPIVNNNLDDKYKSLYLNYGKSLVQVGAYNRAEQFYNSLLQAKWLDLNTVRRIKLDQAELLENQGLYFEQQEVYRQLLSKSDADFEVIRMLFEATLQHSPSINCRALLILMKEISAKTKSIVHRIRYQARIAIAEARLFENENNILQAISVLENCSETLRESKPVRGLASRLLEIDTELFRLYLKNKQYTQCDEIVNRYPNREDRVLTIRFLKNLADHSGKFHITSFLRDTRAAHNASGRLTSLFKVALFAEQFGLNDDAIALIDEVLRREPDSRRALVQKGKLLRKMGRFGESTRVYEQLSSLYPEDPYYVRAGLELAMKKGLYSDAVEATSFITDNDLPILPLVIRARALWGAGQEEESLQVYQQVLSKSVNNELQQKLASVSTGKKLEQTEKDGGPFWGLFYYDLGNRLDNLNDLESKDGFLALVGTEEGKVVADLYSSYRYEKMLNKEYKARKAIVEKRFVAAKRQYQRNLKDEESGEGLKDLAMIYERLGDYGKEAEIYSVITERGEKTPEIEESIKRNERIRSPLLGIDYLFTEKDGREGAKNIIREEGGLGFKSHPGLTSDLELQYHELSYRPVDETETVEGRLMRCFGKWDIIDTTSMTYDLGIHILDDEGDTTLLYDIRVDHRFDENLKGYMSLGQDLVDDSIDSLRQAIDSRNLNIGFVIDGDSGFVVGGELSRRSYSDDNDNNRVYLWGSYSLFSEFTTMTLQYSYELQKNSVAGEIVTDTESGEQSYNMAYWSPGDYWVHQASFTFQHLLRNFEEFKQDAGHYSLNFTIGYESEENLLYSTKFDIFLEMSEHLLLKGDLLYEKSADYDESKAAFSLIYRW